MNINDYPSKLTGTAYYYVRMAWEDEESQLGQYRTLKSAIAKADANPGSFVFTGDGISIYPEDEEETVTVSEGTEEISLDAPEPTQDEAEDTESAEGKEVVDDAKEAVKTDSDASEEGAADEDGTEEASDADEADAKTEAVGSDYPNDGNTETILYGRATTLVNIRDGNSLEADKVTVIRKGTLVEILEECDNGWFRIKCDSAECGYGYIAGEFLAVGSSLYTVQPSDSLWKIAEKTLGSGQKYTEIKTLNGLTSNVIKVGMKLLIP